MDRTLEGLTCDAFGILDIVMFPTSPLRDLEAFLRVQFALECGCTFNRCITRKNSIKRFGAIL